jgi:hypothetical protein
MRTPAEMPTTQTESATCQAIRSRSLVRPPLCTAGTHAHLLGLHILQYQSAIFWFSSATSSLGTTVVVGANL